MTERNDDPRARTDRSSDTDDTVPVLDLGVDRRTALKGSAAGLAALGIGSMVTGSGSAGHNANKVAAAGESTTALWVESKPGEVVSEMETLLGPLAVKTSRDPKQALSFQPTIESSLFTKTHVEKSSSDDDHRDTSQAEAGVLGWIEVNGDATGGEDKIVTVGGRLVDAPTSASDLIPDDDSSSFVDDGGTGNDIIKEKYRNAVVAFDTRAYEMQWTWKPKEDEDDQVDDEEMEAHMRTRSAHGFGWIAPLQGENTIEFKGVTYVYENDTGSETNAPDDPSQDTTAKAVAFVGNRTVMIDPIKLHHDVQ